jgi:heme a synthase
MQSSRSLLWFRRLAFAGALLAAGVVVLGAWVRLTAAGLGCPDWPGCYGHWHPAGIVADLATTAANYPDRPFEYAKAWHEMLHRYVAASLGAIIVGLLLLGVANRKNPDFPWRPGLALFVLVCAQGALGAFTVTLLLKPLIVTLHLLGGLATLATLVWLASQPPHRDLSANDMRSRRMVLGAAAVLLVQIALGGWTSSNYAAVACPDLPTCQGSYWPDMDARNAFVLWRGLGVDYQGGVLQQPARVAIHFTHRLGAVLTGFVLLGTGLALWWRGRAMRLRRRGLALAGAVLLQIVIGIAMVKSGFPLALATLHNAGAALLVVSMILVMRELWPAPAVRVA